MLSLLVGWGVGVGRVSDTDGHVLYFNLLTFFYFLFYCLSCYPSSFVCPLSLCSLQLPGYFKNKAIYEKWNPGTAVMREIFGI